MPRHTSPAVAFALLLALAAAARAPGQPATRPATMPEAEQACRDVLARFMKAIADGDATGIERSVAYDATKAIQRDGVDALTGCAVAQRDFNAAVAARWGADAAVPIADAAGFSAADRALVATATFEWRGADTAVLLVGQNRAPIEFTRSRGGGPWRVIVGALRVLYDFRGRAEAGSQARLAEWRGVAAALRAVTAQVRDGKFESPAAATTALDKAIDLVSEKTP